jgi:hypothetical protein
MTRELLLDPTGSDERTEDGTLARRPVSLRGLTVGLLDNTKPNTTALLTEMAHALERQHGVAASHMYTKDYFGTPVKDELLKQIVQECDVVVTGVGDCGSCSAATVADGILFERAGVPAVSICSDSFLMSGRAMAKVKGFPGYEFLTVPHPFASIDALEIRGRAHDLMPSVQRLLGAEA